MNGRGPTKNIKTVTDTPVRIFMDSGDYLSHGINVFGVHVDCVIAISDHGYPIYLRKATNEEVLKYCKEL